MSHKTVVRVIPPVITNDERKQRIERIKSVAKELWVSQLVKEVKSVEIRQGV